MSDIDDDLDPQPELTELLTRLADDPDAPPSSVSALSVIAAARAEARTAATDATGAWTGDKPPAPQGTGSTSGRNRPGRRQVGRDRAPLLRSQRLALNPHRAGLERGDDALG